MKVIAVLELALAATLLSGCAGREYAARDHPYYKPLNSPGTKFSGLPPAVQNTVRAEAGGAEISDIVNDNFAARPVYEIYFRNAELFPPLYVAEDGSVLNRDFTVAVGAPSEEVSVISGSMMGGMKLADLPKKVLETIHKRAPTSEIASINKESHGAKTYYEVGFKNAAPYPQLFILEDGTILSEVPQ